VSKDCTVKNILHLC